MGTQNKRPSVGERMLEQSYRLIADGMRPKPAAPVAAPAPEAPAELSVEDLAALTTNGA